MNTRASVSTWVRSDFLFAGLSCFQCRSILHRKKSGPRGLRSLQPVLSVIVKSLPDLAGNVLSLAGESAGARIRCGRPKHARKRALLISPISCRPRLKTLNPRWCYAVTGLIWPCLGSSRVLAPTDGCIQYALASPIKNIGRCHQAQYSITFLQRKNCPFP